MCSTSILIVFLITVNSVSLADIISNVSSSASDTDCSANNKFKCKKTGRCIAINWRCDGDDSDCGYGDQSDEQNCTGKTCPSGEFKCKSGQCILIKWKCDGEKDCYDGTDELECNDNPT
ncbi:very low-density lipoprotein receptor-like isoform X2 [Mytilus californianus]|uniref:very low-density lipoprotein receptor-like isoform X2 n=1 Tax=Mytilus californianus TaxID=6549 RepID=UPI0022479F9A|nr:very low-density lipoprotein receptor-like isoform X2 [Mytilus californianus]